ncbi:MAG: EamA family transporter [Candidatus Kariarchaeaceae archaeon]|jgi:drug/metabolite transporter (DMT)-like permease
MVEIGILAAITAVILFAFTSVISKHILTRVQAPYYYLQLQIIFMLPVLVVILGLTADFTYLIEQRYLYLLDLIISATLAFAGMLTLMLGISQSNASTAGVFLSTRVIFSIPLAIIFLQEFRPLYVYALIGLILVGALLTSYDPAVPWKQILQGKQSGVRWLVLTSLFWAVANFYTTVVTQVIRPIEYLSLRIIIFAILAVLISPIARPMFDQNRTRPSRSLLPILTAFTVFTLSAQFLFILALSTSLTITEGIGVFEGVATFVLSMVIAKFSSLDSLDELLDRKSILVRGSGAIVATVGVLLLVLL